MEIFGQEQKITDRL